MSFIYYCVKFADNKPRHINLSAQKRKQNKNASNVAKGTAAEFCTNSGRKQLGK